MTTVFGRHAPRLAAMRKQAAVTAEFGRLAPKLAALRLSPLMGMFLSALCALVLFAALFAIQSVTVSPQLDSPPSAEWRLPTLDAIVPIQINAPTADMQTLSRPIFAKSRRPAVQQSKTTSEEVSVVPPPTGLQVAAITIFNTEKRAFLISSSLPEGEWFASGEKIDEWTIADMEESSLTLKNGSQSIRLRLYPESELQQ